MHAHIVNIVAAELARRGPHERPPRILDVGCGDGRFISYANRRLFEVLGRSVELWGVDVTDAAIQREGYFECALELLRRADPNVDWAGRLHQVRSADPWPFEAASFDVVVSNQVGEHIHDISSFLMEGARVVRWGGFAVHIFPLKQYLLEGHTGIPFAHRILSHDLRELYLTTFARLRLSRVGPLRMLAEEQPSDFGRTRSDYVSFETIYRSWVDVATAAVKAGWRASYRYTTDLYVLKVGYLLGRDFRSFYRRPRPLLDLVLFRPLALVSSVTVFLEREQTYDPSLHSVR